MSHYAVALMPTWVQCYTEKAEEAGGTPRNQYNHQPSRGQPQEAVHADLTKPNPTPTRYTLAKDAIILHIATLQAASSQHTHVGKSPAHTASERDNPPRCGRNGTHEAPPPLSASTCFRMAADQVEIQVSGAARGGDGGGQWRGGLWGMIFLLSEKAEHKLASVYMLL